MKHFTRDQIEEIRRALLTDSSHDTDLPAADAIAGGEYVAIVQDDKNVKTDVDAIKNYTAQKIKADGVDGKVLSDNNYTTVEKTKLSGIESGAQVNIIEKVKVNGSQLNVTDKAVNVDLSGYVPTSVMSEAASPSNKLADKNWVNSTVSTATAQFRGTSVPNLSEAQFLAWANNLTHDLNDYVYWNTVDSAGNVLYKRYKYNGSNWVFEYTLNNSSFTADEWASIQSGMTSALKDKIAGMPSIVNVEEAISAANSAAQNANAKALEAGNVNATLSGYNITVTDRNGDSVTKNIRGQKGEKGDEPVLTAGEDGTIYVDGTVLTEVIKYAKSQAASDHTRAESDHSAASSDHTRAGNDHNTASDDHSTASDDHSTASSDHSRAESDHSTAASDHSTAESDHTRAESDHAIAAQDHATLDAKIAHKADIDGSYEQMSVGTAKNLEGRSEVTDSFFERTTGGDAEVANGLAQITEVKGKSQVWKQLVKNGNFEENSLSDWIINSARTPYSFTNRILTISNMSGSVFLSQYCKITNGHKYLINLRGGYFSSEPNNISRTLFCFVGVNTQQVISAKDDNKLHEYKLIVSATIDNPQFGFATYPSYTGLELHIDCDYGINIIDLTLLGIDNLTTVAEVEAWLASNIGLKPYYPYDPGSVLNVKMKGVESLGFNLLDPATGKARIIGAYSDVYGNYYGITGTHGALTFTSDLGETSTIAPDSDGKFLLETPGWLDVATPGADCAVFLWWNGTRTEYEDYDREVANLDVTHIYGKLNGTGERVQVWPNGVPGVNDVKDVLRVENDAVVARRRNGEVDMGTLNFAKTTAAVSGVTCFQVTITGSSLLKSLCSKYIMGGTTRYALASIDKAYAPYDNSNSADVLVIRDSAYDNSTAADFKTAMNGVKLVYQLANEQVYTDLVYQGSDLFADGTPVTLPVPYIVNNWGLERVIPQNPAEGPITSAPEISIKYGVDAVEQLDTIRTSGVSVEDLKANLQALLAVVNDKLGATMGGTIAIGSTPTDKVYPFTFVPTPEPEPTNEGE